MYKVHCLNNISPVGLANLKEGYELTDDINEADAILVRSADMHEMEIPANLKVVARAGAGVNNIPLDKFAEAGIAVFNTPGANANAVKELVLAGMFMAARDIVGGIEWVKANADDPNVGKAAEKAKKQFAGGEIMGKTLGVIGLGAIGRLVVGAAEALGMKVVGYDPFLDAEKAAAISENMTFVTDLADLYPVCDYITIHVPAMATTKGMINAEAFAQMKDGVVFLNFARDTLVNDADLAAACEAGKVARYVTDFANPAVVKIPAALVIPHLGASTAEAEDNCATMAVNSVMAYLEEGNTFHKVN
ncbi:3-phosphoglycerate dehydrogenase [Slackia heliotrinireducens]|uniref:Phosphoglycerate dehydrogenase-like oxidoreductase n=1 Tax=Slackia heliotrinireducens (strain ATCC 29202 / DSM 20476 / NCTC 11029 / RHS 1) TaxID=471855 RepID=C7N476_SLAHD|nr:3-phosphoglycerate dehydrogenase [Slackia heliotrinireducens]ACV23812.1 phosphoglycerate dehydrogenase-like oxidoreductase [Slackia heliotrinireducens DSM 20476]VEH03497.1 D-3-phosphoglycerate dehydrogenase [Slackia heliotrinireducens]